MTTQEGNKLIAEFMGWKRMATKASNWLLSYEVEGMKYAVKQCSDTQLKFNNSWDWLMPVVEKIESIEGKKFMVEIQSTYTGIIDRFISPETPFISLTGSAMRCTKIEITYQVVIKFIQWYNSQSKPTGNE